MTAIPLSERRFWIGSSESAVLLGVSSFQTRFEIWHEKAGNIPARDLDGDDRVQAGKFLEPAIAAWAGERWGMRLRKVNGYLKHPVVQGMGASLDYEEADDFCEVEGEPPVEIKNVDSMIFRDQWTAESDELLDAPTQYLVQVQHQLACRPAATHGWLIACVGGNRLFRMRVPRHARLISRIEREVDDFWASIQAGTEPKPDFQADAAAIQRLYADAGDVIADMSDNNRLAELVHVYQRAKAEERAGKAAATEARAEILSIIEGHRKVKVAGGFWINAPTVQEVDVAYTREAYRLVRITQQRGA